MGGYKLRVSKSFMVGKRRAERLREQACPAACFQGEVVIRQPHERDLKIEDALGRKARKKVLPMSPD
jgi:hypothetical protein